MTMLLKKDLFSATLCDCRDYFFFSLAEHDQLFYLVHEKVKVKSESLGPHLWTYRQKISLEHLGLTLKEEKLKKAYPILHVFLVEVS